MRVIHALVVCALAAGTACDPATTSPSAGPNLTGTWSGLLGEPMSMTALRVSWQASQSGSDVTGPATLVKPASNIPANGTLSATLSGSSLSLRYEAHGGTVSGFPLCSMSGLGSATVSGSTISGTLALTFTACQGTGLQPPGSNQLALTRQ